MHFKTKCSMFRAVTVIVFCGSVFSISTGTTLLPSIFGTASDCSLIGGTRTRNGVFVCQRQRIWQPTKMTSTEISFDIGRHWGFALSDRPPTIISTESGVEILPVTKVFVNGVGNSSSNSNVSVLTSVVQWSVGGVSALAVMMNLFLIIMVYKGQLLKKDHRLIYYMFMSIGAICFATSMATNSLSVLISETNLFPVFGACLMVQATAMGSFHMIGLSIVLLTHELYNHVVSPLGSNLSIKTAGGAIKCVGCYTLAILVCYLPFSFWTDHPQEVPICSIPAIYAQHVHAANYLGIFSFCAIATLIIVTNCMLIKATKSADWRTKLRIRKDMPSSQIRGFASSEESPAERTEPTTIPTTTDIQQTDTVVEETRFTDKQVPGLREESSTKEICPPRFSPSLQLPHRPSSVSTETQATTYDEGSKDTTEIQTDEVAEDRKEILEQRTEEKEIGDIQSTLLEESSVFTDALEDLDAFFVSGPSAELESSRPKSRKLKDSLVLSVMTLPAAKEAISQENVASLEEVIKVETASSLGLRLSSRQRLSKATSKGTPCCFPVIPCCDWTARPNKSGQGRSIEVDSISSTESIKKRHLENRKFKLRTFLKAVRTEMIFALVYIICTLISLVWNIKNLSCTAPCSSEETAFMDFYYLGMAVLPFINPIILFATLK